MQEPKKLTDISTVEGQMIEYDLNDIPDLPVIKAAGIGAAPADAAEDVVNAASYVCKAGGGRGCVREVIEKVLRAQGLWYFDEDEFSKIF